MSTPVFDANDGQSVVTAPEPDEGTSLKFPEPAGVAPNPGLVNKIVTSVEKTSPDSGYVAENPTDLPYVVAPGSALTIGGGQGPGVAAGLIQGRNAGRYIPDFSGDVDNDQLPEANAASVKAVKEALKAQGIK